MLAGDTEASGVSMSTDDLHPLFKPIADDILSQAQAKITPLYPGSTIRPDVTLRSMADQAAALAAGLTTLKLGWHQFGFAMDVAVLAANGSYVKDGEDVRYALFGRVAMDNGCVWGGSWHNPDWDHCEYHPGFTLQQYLAWLTTVKTVTA